MKTSLLETIASLFGDGLRGEDANLLRPLAKNYGFKIERKKGKLPTRDYVYPDFTADGNSEAYRFNSGLRQELKDRAYVVTQGLEGKTVAYTSEDSTLLEVAKIAPRLGLEEQITGRINSIYHYSPLLFIGTKNSEFAAYVVKPTINYQMAWFELTKEETQKVKELLENKAKGKK